MGFRKCGSILEKKGGKIPQIRRGQPGRQQEKGTKSKREAPPRSEQEHQGKCKGEMI